MQDRGDGTYDVGVLWNPAIAPQPGVVLTQPDRPPVTLTLPGVPGGAKAGCSIWVVVLLAVLLLVAVLLLLL